jgi:hypothetical protein
MQVYRILEKWAKLKLEKKIKDIFKF